ncbi:hypothetical protein OG203_10005 [Nocardia sp. NBC_01499]|uniref:hypothetical protein n=1 Tax=Nocardia sp. NBC_01499 TaxID=2903597 RepID=UPI003863050C
MAYLSALIARRTGHLTERDMTVALLAFPRRLVPFGVYLAAERDMVAGLLVLSRHHVPFGEVCLPS